MPTTSWHNVPGTYPQLQAAVNYDSMTRVNNTVYLYGVDLIMQINQAGGGYDYYQWHGSVQAGQDGGGHQSIMSDRQVKAKNVRATQGTNYYSSESNGSIAVSAGATGGYLDASAYSDVGGSVSAWGLNIPNLGAPTGLSCTIEEVGTTYFKVRGKVGSWGTNATHGPGQYFEYEVPAGSTKQRSGHTTSANYVYTVSGVRPNARCFADNNATNGGGKSADGPNVHPVTKPYAATGSLTASNVQATTATIGCNPYNGYYDTETTMQYRQVGENSWHNAPSHTGNGTFTVPVTGLQPSTDYEYRGYFSTDAGSSTNGTHTFKTLPAAKLILSDGTVRNAVPHIIHADGTVEKADVKVVT
jgi:hypothetical protein